MAFESFPGDLVPDGAEEPITDEMLEQMLAEAGAAERVLALLDGTAPVAIKDGHTMLDAEEIRRELVARLERQGASWEAREAAFRVLIALVVAGDARFIDQHGPNDQQRLAAEAAVKLPIGVNDLAERVRSFVILHPPAQPYPSVNQVTAHIIAEEEDMPLSVEWLMSLRMEVGTIIASLKHGSLEPEGRD